MAKGKFQKWQTPDGLMLLTAWGAMEYSFEREIPSLIDGWRFTG